MKLLVDGFINSPSDVKVQINEEAGQKKYYIKGVFAQAETPNRNGRRYPKDVMSKALGQYDNLITKKRALGELNHPEHPNVNLERASHLIEALAFQGNNVIGKARILTEMPMGKIVRGLIDEGVQIGVSTRGLGTLVPDNKGLNIVQPDFVMTAIDVVGDPSAPDAFVQGIVEGAEWLFNVTSSSWVPASKIKNLVSQRSVQEVDNIKARLFEQFLKSL